MSPQPVSSSAKGSAKEWKTFRILDDGIAMGRLPEHWIGEAVTLTRTNMTADSAQAETMHRVWRHNRDSFWGLFQRDGDSHSLIGYFAQLMLNGAGHAALCGRSLDRKHPDLQLLTRTGERPDAVYLWGMVAPGRLALFRSYLAQQLEVYAGLPHYATLATEGGLKVGRNIGLRPVTPEDDRIGGLFLFRKGASHHAPLASRIAGAPDVRVSAARTTEEVEQARAIRAAVFMGEQQCPYEEEFDGNDQNASHIVGYVNGSPVAAMRVRYFADWAKLERLAIIDRFRKTPVKDEIIAYAIDLARRKGYRMIYGQAQKRLLEFWKRRGFELFPRNASIQFSDHDYVEIFKALDPHEEPVTLRSDPMVINRPEGHWDEPGPLDRSTRRPVTRPC